MPNNYRKKKDINGGSSDVNTLRGISKQAWEIGDDFTPSYTKKKSII